VLAAQRGRTRVAEIGTGCGVGSAWILSALDPDVRFVTVELDGGRAAAALSPSSSTVTKGISGASAERIQAEPTPQPVPISPTRVRPRWPARTWRSRPASALHDFSNPRRAARASARATSGGSTVQD
jgi:hypothetical protein